MHWMTPFVLIWVGGSGWQRSGDWIGLLKGNNRNRKTMLHSSTTLGFGISGSGAHTQEWTKGINEEIETCKFHMHLVRWPWEIITSTCKYLRDGKLMSKAQVVHEGWLSLTILEFLVPQTSVLLLVFQINLPAFKYFETDVILNSAS